MVEAAALPGVCLREARGGRGRSRRVLTDVLRIGVHQRLDGFPHLLVFQKLRHGVDVWSHEAVTVPWPTAKRRHFTKRSLNDLFLLGDTSNELVKLL